MNKISMIFGLMLIFSISHLSGSFYQTEEWTEIIESGRTEDAAFIAETIDGNYVITGGTDSLNFGGTKTGYLKKLDQDGNILWSKTYADIDGTGFVDALADGTFLIAAANKVKWLDENGNSTASINISNFSITRMAKTNDSGYILLDNTTSGLGYFRIRKVGSTFGEVWTKFIDHDGNHQSYPHGSQLDHGYSVKQTADGGFIITGWSYFGSDTGKNVYLVKTDNNGDVLWEKSFGDGGQEKGYSVIEDSDGNFLIVGTTLVSQGDKVLALKATANGDSIWYEVFSSSGWMNHVIASSNGGYLAVGGYEDWNNENYPSIMRISTDGESEWSENTYFDNIYGKGITAMQDSDGDYVFCGWSNHDYTHTNESNIYVSKYSEIEDQDIVVNEVLPFIPEWPNNEIIIAEDDTIHFEIDAYDPDGNDLTYEWMINWGAPVCTTYAFTFDLDSNVGDQYEIAVNVDDGFWNSDETVRSSVFYQWLITVVEGVDPPTDLQITISGDQIQLDWNEITSASKYNIYGSDTPEGEFTKITEITGSSNTTWTTNITDAKKFYRVTSVQ